MSTTTAHRELVSAVQETFTTLKLLYEDGFIQAQKHVLCGITPIDAREAEGHVYVLSKSVEGYTPRANKESHG